MGAPVVTVAAGGLPVVEAATGTPVTEATNGYGVAVTKVVGKPGLPVVFETIGGGGGGGGGIRRSAMVGGVFVNSDGVGRETYIDGAMLNL